MDYLTNIYVLGWLVKCIKVDCSDRLQSDLQNDSGIYYNKGQPVRILLS